VGLGPCGNESGYHGMCHSDSQNIRVCAFNSFTSNACLDLMPFHLSTPGGNDKMP
jgi:hypothetical protein